jgi:hypothetical protein
MDEHWARCGQGGWIGERLVREEQTLVLTHLKRLQAEAARAIPGCHFGMDRVTVLGRLHGFFRGGGDRIRNALNSIGAHGSVSKEVPTSVAALAWMHTPILAVEFAQRAA